jgi:hypothetical protein
MSVIRYKRRAVPRPPEPSRASIPPGTRTTSWHTATRSIFSGALRSASLQARVPQCRRSDPGIGNAEPASVAALDALNSDGPWATMQVQVSRAVNLDLRARPSPGCAGLH